MVSDTLPDVTESELRALRIAARQMPWTRREERVERHPLGKGYVAALADLGLLGYTETSRGRSLEITALAVDLLGAVWRGEKWSTPRA